jgi:hypothetical protein
MKSSGPDGVNFHHQGQSDEFRWGDIADFDPTIFNAYLENPGGLNTEVKFDLGSGSKQYQAGARLPLRAYFEKTTRTVELEKLSRCANGRVIWEPVRNLQVRNESSAQVEDVLHDSGPNRDGSQYFRVRTYGRDGRLMGWNLAGILLTGYEPDATYASEKFCQLAYGQSR